MASATGYPISPVPFTAVSVTDAFWQPRLETNRKVTLPYCFQKCEETHRIANFDKAAGVLPGAHEGIFFNDSDVYKVLEGAAYTLALVPDPALDAYVDGLIARIGAAQEEDGYLYTARTIDPEAVSADAEGLTRWSNLAVNHELYNVGHMYEAAVAHFQATGKRNFLDIALRNADLICQVFGPDGIHDVPGHQEIELGLVKLYQVTGSRQYLDLAHFFLDQRGRHASRAEVVRFGNPGYLQDHLPVADQGSAVGHAVRAGYMYAGMADVAALHQEKDWVRALEVLWQDVVAGKLYLHGGIGARHEGEAFGEPYELPNDTAYAETCAAIANVYWNHRMFLLQGRAEAIDVLELSLYNGVLSGISLSGTAFFYPNPLSSDGEWEFNKGAVGRQPWFDCSCCPSNLVRFLPALPGWIYAVQTGRVYVNLYVGSLAAVQVPGTEAEVSLTQHTHYPWHGDVAIELGLATPAHFALALRVPGWLQAPAPGGLYSYAARADVAWEARCNGEVVKGRMENGYILLEADWQNGDVVTVTWPMPIRRVACHPAVDNNRGRQALMRGPLVYCVEAADNEQPVPDIRLGADLQLEIGNGVNLQAGMVSVRGQSAAGGFRAVPYHLWAHRDIGPMAVWLPTT